jgi:hypothetical protein
LPAYLYLSLAGAFLLALPFVPRLFWASLVRRDHGRERVFGLWFVLFSYLASMLSVFTAQRFLFPALVEYLLRSTGWCSETWTLDLGVVLNAYVARAVVAVMAIAAGLQLCLTAVALRVFARR